MKRSPTRNLLFDRISSQRASPSNTSLQACQQHGVLGSGLGLGLGMGDMSSKGKTCAAKSIPGYVGPSVPHKNLIGLASV